jgi:hypothetical protein
MKIRVRLFLATAYWCFVVAMFFQHWGAERLPVIIGTLPWSAVALAWVFFLGFFLQAFGANIPELSDAITTIVHFVVLVIICGGLNAALIANSLAVGKGRFPSNFKFHRPRRST